MSQAFACEPSYSRGEDCPAFPAHRANENWPATGTLEGPTLPTVLSGQLWLVEIAAIAPEAAPLEYRALTTANVVIYDRALGSTVSAFLPLGGYAEPAGPPETSSERCIRFIRDGWSVARLVLPRRLSGRKPTDELHRLAERLIALDVAADLAALAFANAGGGTYQCRRVTIEQMRATSMRESCFEQSSTLTIVFEAPDAFAGSHFSVASANGLAG